MYLKKFISDPKVGALTSSSKFCVKDVTNKINFSGKKVFIEFGSGAGEFTKSFLSRMDADAKIVAIETNVAFIKKLKEINDPRLIVEHDSAENIKLIMEKHQLEKADYIVSGIPLTLIPSEIRKKIIAASVDALKDTGSVIFYQYSFYVKKLLKPHLAKISIGFTLLNLPPMFIIEGTGKLNGKILK